ncbi:site-specific DNA-methyltransferase [Bacillus sp. FSL W7-1360]
MRKQLELNNIYHNDCIEGMRMIADGSIDMILCDLPYGVTGNDWDSKVPLFKLWDQYRRVIKDNGAIILTAIEPFTSELIMSNAKMFRYCLIWDKKLKTGFLNAKKIPLRQHENILVFYRALPTYNPQMTQGKTYKTHGPSQTAGNYGGIKGTLTDNETGERYPTTILEIPQVRVKGGHPNQKPIALFEYLIKTYTNEGDTVLDNCMGSGTTAVAAKQLNRNYIGFDTNSEYVDMAQQRVESAVWGSSL